MKLAVNTAPVMEGLEPRLLLSGTALGSVASSATEARWLAGTVPAARAQQFSHNQGWTDARQKSQAALGRTEAAAAAPASPSSQVTGQAFTYAGALYLNVLGTNGADVITISQTDRTVTVATAQATLTFTGNFRCIAVYGFDGDDTIRITYSVLASVTVYAGAGNDTVYAAGRGNDTIYGEAGDDALITIGGGADRVFGGDGRDTFWVDGNDATSDTAVAETAGGTVHRVYQFYGNVSMDVKGQNLADPALTGNAARYANFASRPLFAADGPNYTDIRQGYLGDCYLLASFASLADAEPESLRQMITPLGDGTYAVRFYRNGSPVYLRIDADLPVTSGGSLAYARLSSSGEIWVPLLEKAYAFFRTGAGTYASIEGGWMGPVYRDVLNRASTTISTSLSDQQVFAALRDSLSAGRAVTAGSRSSGGGPIIGCHAYQVRAAYTDGSGTMYVTVYNPWGYDGAGSDGNSSDGLVTLRIADFRTYFTAAIVMI